MGVLHDFVKWPSYDWRAGRFMVHLQRERETRAVTIRICMIIPCWLKEGLYSALVVTFDQTPKWWRPTGGNGRMREIRRVMDWWCFRWMSLCNITELWRSTVHNPQSREWCIDRKTPGSNLHRDIGDTTPHPTSWPFNKTNNDVQPIDSPYFKFTHQHSASGGTDVFTFKLKHEGLWQMIAVRSLTAVSWLVRAACSLVVQPRG